MNIINEDPDMVTARAENLDLFPFDSDAVAFFCSKEWGVLGKQRTHPGIIAGLEVVYWRRSKNLKGSSIEGCHVYGLAKLIDDLYNTHSDIGNYMTLPEGFDLRTDFPKLLSGRIWVDRKVIAFWDDQEKVIDYWYSVVNMFKNSKTLGDLLGYKIDWLERTQYNEPLAPTGTINPENTNHVSDDVDDDGQINFFKKLFTNVKLLDKLPTDKLKVIRDKMHVMNPEVKQAIMKLDGVNFNKSVEIADKLGMSVITRRRMPLDIEFMLESLTGATFGKNASSSASTTINGGKDENGTPLESDDFGIIEKDVGATLKESPDGVVYCKDNERLQVMWSSKDAVPFFIFPTFSVVAKPNDTHSDILYQMRKIYLSGKKENNDSTYAHINVSNENNFYDYLFGEPNILTKMFDESEMRKTRSRLVDDFLFGRLWTDRHIISFWNKQSMVINRWDEVEKFFNDMDSRLGNLDLYAIDWLYRSDNDPLTPASDVSAHKLPNTNFPLTTTEREKLEKILHVLPAEAKAQVLKAGGNIINKAAEMADKLGISQAELNAHKNVDEEILTEDPDTVCLPDGNLSCGDSDAIAFFATNDYSVIGPKKFHSTITNILYKKYELMPDVVLSDKEFIEDRPEIKIYISDPQKLYEDFKEKKYFGKVFADNDINSRSGLAGLTGGRLWTDSKIISFYKKHDEVVDEWPMIIKMFEDFRNMLGKLDDYKIDWVERYNPGDPLTPSSELTDKHDSRTHINKLSPEDLKRIQDKIHLLDPATKAEVMKAIGPDVLVNRAAEIAAKLGMSVAEFNSIWNLNENYLTPILREVIDAVIKDID